MSDFKISGACTSCDEMCFEVLSRWGENERYPGEPKGLGAVIEGSRITFMLYDGARCDLTFCDKCAAGLNPGSYVGIWRKVLRSWIREMSKGNPAPHAWFPPQFHNGVLGEMGRISWKELTNGN